MVMIVLIKIRATLTSSIVRIMSLILMTLLDWPLLVGTFTMSSLVSFIEWFINGAVVFGTLSTVYMLGTCSVHTLYAVLTLTLLSLWESNEMSSNPLSVTGNVSDCSLRPISL